MNFQNSTVEAANMVDDLIYLIVSKSIKKGEIYADMAETGAKKLKENNGNNLTVEEQLAKLK